MADEDLSASNPKYTPMENPVTTPWEVSISDTTYKKLSKGFLPEDMDDKWALYADAPDAEGNFVLHMCRSWTGDEQVALTVQQSKITQFQWIKKDESEENDAKLLAKNLCKRFLDCDLEASE